MTRHVIRHGKRTFVVTLDGEGQPLNIRERKTVTRFGVALVFDYSYWNAKHHKVGGPNTLTAMVLAAAKDKTRCASPTANYNNSSNENARTPLSSLGGPGTSG